MCESAVHQVTPQPTGRSVADQGELRVSTWPGPAWRQHRPSRSGAPAGTRTRPRQAPGSAACNWAPIRSVRPPARRWVNRPGGQRASPAGKGDRRERHDGEQKHLGAINTTDQLEDRAGPGAVAAGGDPPAQQAEDALDKATAPLPQGPRPRWRPPACRHRDRAPPGPAPGPPLPGRPYSRTGARWACLSADASAAGWGRRASAGGEEGLQYEYQCLLDVSEDADRPAQGGHRPSGTGAAWPPCPCHCDHLIGGRGRTGCQAVSRDRTPAQGRDFQGATGVAIWFAAAVPLEVVLADMQLQEWPIRVAEPAERAGRSERAKLGISSSDSD